jgi:hypothetical protein
MLFGDATRGSTQGGKTSAGVNFTHTHARHQAVPTHTKLPSKRAEQDFIRTFGDQAEE